MVILDLTVPGGMGGLEAFEGIRSVNPEAVCIASSGYSEDPVLSHHRDHGFASVLKKPYGFKALERALVQATQDVD